MPKLIYLQALRGIAASLVVIDHALGLLVATGTAPASYQSVSWFVGWLGVATFFIISGLIMVRTTGRDFGARGGAASFAIRRIERVAPLYWLATAVALLLTLHHPPPAVGMQLMKSILFIPYVRPGETAIRPLLGQGWTLDYEMFFYAIFTVCLLFSRRIGLLLLSLGLVALVLLGALVRPLTHYVDTTTVPQFYTDPLMLLFAIGAGLGLFEATRHKDNLATLDKALRGLSKFPLVPFALTLGGAVLIFAACKLSFPLQLGWQLFFATLCLIAVVAATSYPGNDKGVVIRTLEICGDASYSTYLVHNFIVLYVFNAWRHLPLLKTQPISFLVIVIVAANLLGYAVHKLVEKPLAAILKRATQPLINRLRAPRALPPAALASDKGAVGLDS